MKKKIIIGIVVVIVIALIIVASIIFINNNGSSNLSLIDKIMLNDKEQEILEVLKKADYSLKNPQPKEEDTNTVDFTITMTEPTEFKTIISKIYEGRKYTAEEGTESYLFDVELNFEDKEINSRRYISVNDNGVTIFPRADDVENIEIEDEGRMENGAYTFGKEFYKTIFEGLENQINDIWQQSATYSNVNYDKVYNKI